MSDQSYLEGLSLGGPSYDASFTGDTENPQYTLVFMVKAKIRDNRNGYEVVNYSYSSALADEISASWLVGDMSSPLALSKILYEDEKMFTENPEDITLISLEIDGRKYV